MVAVAVFATATVLPAVLAILGDKVDALRLPYFRRRTAKLASDDSLWGRLAGRVSRRPGIWGGLSAAALLALAVPAVGMSTSLGGIETLPKDLNVVTAYRQLTAAVPTDGTALRLVVKAPPQYAGVVRSALLAVGPTARGIEHVVGVAPEVSASLDHSVSTLTIGVGMDASDGRLGNVVDTVRSSVLPALERQLSDVPGVEVHLGGDAAVPDLSRWMTGRLPWVMGFVLTLTLVVMLLSFGSVWLAVATLALNLLSVGAAFGAITLVFQGSWAEGLLDFTSTGSIAAWLPLLLFVVLFGLSMDYHVFVLSRVREARDAGASPTHAVRLGLARSAGVVTSAAAVMVGVFSVFGTLSLLEMKQLGVGLAVAVFLDATVVRGVLLPATLTLLGDRAHRGPRWLPTLHH